MSAPTKTSTPKQKGGKSLDSPPQKKHANYARQSPKAAAEAAP
jgi:hypothetical protein